MEHGLVMITQNRGLEKVMERLSRHHGCGLHLYESCADFIGELEVHQRGVVVVDATVCSQTRFTDLQTILNTASGWRVIYLPATNKKGEVKEAMSLGAFGCLHKPVNEREVRQMVESAMGM
jgi:DNA-binding NtrC family response regulator